MNNLLKGNYDLEVKVEKQKDDKQNGDEYRERAIHSIGGSMVYVEKTELFWDGGEDSPKDKK